MILKRVAEILNSKREIKHNGNIEKDSTLKLCVVRCVCVCVCVCVID